MYNLNCIILALMCAVTLVFSGCREISADRTYALWLDHAPTTTDWQNALPREVVVRGGRPHKLRSFTELDEDTVHSSTASCHHGARLPEPVNIDVRAFYTDQDLFLRLSWVDETRDQGMLDWNFDGERWRNTGQLEDGLGLMWDAKGQFNEFTCSYACHINDFGVNKSSFHATTKMRLGKPGHWLDLWNWKAARTALHGFADDRYLDDRGMHGDLPGELFTENSIVKTSAGDELKVFSDDDAPVYDAEQRPVDESYHPPGATAPGYLVKRPVGDRADVKAVTIYENDRWVVVLRRALNTGNPNDVVFVPGDEVGVGFGIALMDHTLFEHYASSTVERLVLMKKQYGDM